MNRHSPLLIGLGLLLAGCSAAVSASRGSQQQPAAVLQPTTPTADSSSTVDLARTDEQGAVVITITPLNLNGPGQTLDFEVAMNTHSVNLSMDLAKLATLTTDSGLTAQATQWDAPNGGHHVTGKLSFPVSVNGTSLLSKTTQLTLTIRDVDARERTFKWELS